MEELVLKIPAGKPPFIGVLFSGDDLYRPAKLNAGWVNNYQNSNYKLFLEPVKDKINLRLLEDSIGCNCVYQGLKYNPEQLFKFLALTKNAREIKFGHIVPKQDGYAIVKTITNNRNFVLRIDQLKLLVEH
ncbi:MAG: hypothetical protein ACXVNM_07495 [Bacteroidia bacterium]